VVEAAPPDATAPVPHVTITVTGAPAHGLVKAPNGDTLTEFPGTFGWPRGDQPVTFRFEAQGYKAKTKTIVPDGDQTFDVQLPKKTKKPAGSGSDEIGDF
jgi:hypothetical protein